MASLLRQLVAGPRARHPEAGLDLCYVTDHIIATSGPSQTYPQRAYRNPLDQLVAFLDAKHGSGWAIWEFRAEGTGYPDAAVYGRVRHYPWPDHHPPPFRLVPLVMASMRNWLHGGDLDGGRPDVGTAPPPASSSSSRVVVVHCKAGKGRSGTAVCSYLVAEEGWTPDDALARFTQRRMRPKFGAGVSIPSQLRWIGYVDRWTKGGKKYVDRPIEILEIHVWGLRHGVKVDVEAFVDDGREICVVHSFTDKERVVVEAGAPGGAGFGEMMWELAGYATASATETVVPGADAAGTTPPLDKAQGRSNTKGNNADLIQGADKLRPRASVEPSSSTTSSASDAGAAPADGPEPGGMAVILRPSQPIRIPNSDVNVAVERRNRTHKSMGLTVVSAVAHVWFNAFFDGRGPERHGRPDDSGVFAVTWDAMDGIKGSSRKGTRALDRLAVVWRAADPGSDVPEPPEGQPVPQARPADWTGSAADEPDLGVRAQSPAGADVSRASSLRSGEDAPPRQDGDESMQGVRCSGPAGGELLDE